MSCLPELGCFKYAPKETSLSQRLYYEQVYVNLIQKPPGGAPPKVNVIYLKLNLYKMDNFALKVIVLTSSKEGHFSHVKSL